MRVYGRTSISEFLQDRIIYRSLNPYDSSLPGLPNLQAQLGLAGQVTPRKNEMDYARIVHLLLQESQMQDAPVKRLSRLVFVGDTQLLDGTAFSNLCRVSGWAGLAFIGSEDKQPPALKLASGAGGYPLYISNRWSALEDFDNRCSEHGLPVGEGTAVVLDMDKTMVGGRGRNGQVIDQTRVMAVEQTAADLLGAGFNPKRFRLVYEPLNQPEYHTFTADNQDYLAYTCLMVAAEVFDFESLLRRIHEGDMTSFSQFINEVEERADQLGGSLSEIHNKIYSNVQSGDPTPFKSFRQNEYRLTAARFGCLDDSAPIDRILSEEIVITQEVREMALRWRERGALIFGLSDKPDEASIPTPELAALGYRPLHQAETHSVGE